MSIILISCRSAFKTEKATYQVWCEKEKGLKGVNYHILLNSYTSYKNAKIDSVFVQDKWRKLFKYSVIGKSNTDTCFQKNDKIILSIFVPDTVNVKVFKIAYSKNKKNNIIEVKNFIPLKNLCK
ncbi:MAG: hypothetical protein N3A01_08420 [Bacteroidales bacterium]|nr:hypothetical protein [Bacteroidales bacterium]